MPNEDGAFLSGQISIRESTEFSTFLGPVTVSVRADPINTDQVTKGVSNVNAQVQTNFGVLSTRTEFADVYNLGLSGWSSAYAGLGYTTPSYGFFSGTVFGGFGYSSSVGVSGKFSGSLSFGPYGQVGGA